MTKTLMIASAGLAVLACAAAVLPQPSVADAVAAQFGPSMISGVADVLSAPAAAPLYTLPTMTITAKRLTADEVAAIRAQDKVVVLPTMTITAKRLTADEVAAIRAQDKVAVLPTMTIVAKRLSAEQVAAIRAQDEGALVLAKN